MCRRSVDFRVFLVPGIFFVMHYRAEMLLAMNYGVECMTPESSGAFFFGSTMGHRRLFRQPTVSHRRPPPAPSSHRRRRYNETRAGVVEGRCARVESSY